MTNEIWFDNGQGFEGPMPEGNIRPARLEEQGVKTNLLLIDYHHNYWRLRKRVEELEGKVYELEETVAGSYSDYDGEEAL